MIYDVIVIGGGLAGSSTAIHLVRRGHHVLLLERKRYPVHKLCGEFLSVEVQALFTRLGVVEKVIAAGARRIEHVLVSAPGGRTFTGVLPGTALGLSRYKLDDLLCAEASRLGVDVRTGEDVRDIWGAAGQRFTVRTQEHSFEGRVVVGAYGKRDTLDRKLNRPFIREKAPFVAFKAHYAGIDLGSVIELHAFPGGYCGLSHVENGLVNACWISSEAALRSAGGRPEDMIKGHFSANPMLADRFRSMTRASDRFTAISQISFAQKRVVDSGICMVGDTVGMIGPLCGDGMAMALHSAEIAVPIISAYLRKEITASDLEQSYARAWDAEFGKRMLLGRLAHNGFTIPVLAKIAVHALNTWPALGRWFINNTRGAQALNRKEAVSVTTRAA